VAGDLVAPVGDRREHHRDLHHRRLSLGRQHRGAGREQHVSREFDNHLAVDHAHAQLARVDERLEARDEVAVLRHPLLGQGLALLQLTQRLDQLLLGRLKARLVGAQRYLLGVQRRDLLLQAGDPLGLQAQRVF